MITTDTILLGLTFVFYATGFSVLITSSTKDRKRNAVFSAACFIIGIVFLILKYFR